MKISSGLYRVLEPYLDEEDDLIYFPEDDLVDIVNDSIVSSWGKDIDKYFKKLNIEYDYNIEDFIEQPNISWYTCSFAWIEDDGIHIENYRLKII